MNKKVIEVTIPYLFTRCDYVESDNQPYGALSPKEEYCEIEEEYNYTAYVTFKDVIDYYIEDTIGRAIFRGWTKEKQDGFKKAIELLWEDGFIPDDIISSTDQAIDDFFNWLKRDREEEARQMYEEENR